MVAWFPPVSILLPLLVLGAYAVALGLLWYVEGRDRWLEVLTDRLVYGVPWGTLVVCALVLCVYLFVQGGYWHWWDPLVLPFRSWSYLYPTGVFFSSLAHNSPGHLIGNLTGTLVLGPIVEYAWGHYPRGDAAASHRLDEFGSGQRAGGRRLLRRPWFRAVVAFPALVFAMGLFTSLFFLGPVVGFSGVVFALGGFALVHYPVATIAALLLSSVVRTTYSALQSPVVVQGVSGGAPSPPWWGEIAIQAHAVGVLVGVVLGLALLLRRDERPHAGWVFVAILVYGVSRNLWAVYWIGDDGQYVLFRGIGVLLVVVLAVLVTVAAAASDSPVRSPLRHLRDRWRRAISLGWYAALALAVATAAAGALLADWSLALVLGVVTLAALGLGSSIALHLLAGLPPEQRPTGRQVSFAVLLAATAMLGGVAIYPNLVTLDDDAVPGTGAVAVEDYSVTYEEGVRNRQIPVVPLPGVEEHTRTQTSGAIVVSRERHVWSTALTSQYLASEGRGTVVVGGLGWRETVLLERSGWSVAGNGSVYVVDVAARGERVRSYESEPLRAEPRVAGYNLTVSPATDGFEVTGTRDGETAGPRAVPEIGGSTRLGDLRIRTEETNGRAAVYAVADDTRVRIATREQY